MSATNGNGCLTVRAGLLPALKSALESFFTAQPPPPQPGQYYIAKATQAVTAELPLFLQQKYDLLRKHAPKDDKGEPMLNVIELGNGQTSVSMDPVDKAAFATEDKALGDVPVNLTGVPRLLTAADLGSCPIPQGAYTVLLGVLIEDKPPEGA